MAYRRMTKNLKLMMAALVCAAVLKAQEPVTRIDGSAFRRPAPDKWSASIALDRLPPSPVFLFLKLKTATGPGSRSPFDIDLNGRPVARGQAAGSGPFWTYKRLPVPAGFLRPGPNAVEIRSAREDPGNAAVSSLEIGEILLADHRFAPRLDPMTGFEVEHPAAEGPMPGPGSDRGEPAFPLRGTKGWAWTPEQYLEGIPFLVRARMNFLMNCYTSMFSSLDPFINRWWEPLPENRKRGFEKVVRACQANGLEFCFSMHPQLFSERPLVHDNADDFERLWQHYSWMQGLGVKWFSLCYDDIGVEKVDKASLAGFHARLVNRLLGRLREKMPDARLIFCPTYYWGCGETSEARAYLEALGRALDAEVYLFWTGDGVITPRITRACADSYRKLVNHRLIIWDNYPVNDRNPTLHLGPVTGRDPDLYEAASGYMSNPLCPQNEINRVPLFTCADYAFDPVGYDPLRSIGRAIQALGANASQVRALKQLVELYPGMLLYGETGTDFNPVRQKYRTLLESPHGPDKAAEFRQRVEGVVKEFESAFPSGYVRTKETLRRDLEWMKRAPANNSCVLFVPR